MANREPDISVVIPAYNEVECVAEAVRECAEILAGLGRPFEIIVIDDGSMDGTFDALRQARGEVAELRAIRLARRCGQSAAMLAGFRHARGGIVITMDADRQNDPADIPTLLAELDGWDVVCGVRRKRRDSFVRRLSSRIANGIRNRMTNESITDTGCSLKAFRREWLPRIPMFDGMHRFLPTLLKAAGARVTEVAVNHRERPAGRSKYGIWNRAFKAWRDLLAVRWMQKRWIRYEIGEEIGEE
jgi:glycosyltransferase involved in cell wall biosynthesis